MLIFVSSSPTSLREERRSCNRSYCRPCSRSWRAFLRAKPMPTQLCPRPGSAPFPKTKPEDPNSEVSPSSTTYIKRWEGTEHQPRHFLAETYVLHKRNPHLIQHHLPAAAEIRCSPSSVTFGSLARLLFVNSNIVINTIDWLWELNGKDTVFWIWNIIHYTLVTEAFPVHLNIV